MRLFVAVDLPESLAADVAAVQDRLADADLRFTDPEQAHLTLKFLGDTDPDRVASLTDALERSVDDAGVEPFDLRPGGLGVFPSLSYITVVWLGVRDGTPELTRLHEAIERETTALGFDPESHDEFTPHVTLARMESARGKDHVKRVVREDSPELDPFRVREVRLKSSELGPDGPTYSTVTRVSL